MENRRTLDYLSLEPFVKKRTTDRYHVWCGIESSTSSSYNHTLHTDNSQLNAIIDLLTLVLNNQVKLNTAITNLASTQISYKTELISELKIVRNNIDYLKNHSFSDVVKNYPNKKEVVNLIHNLESQDTRTKTKQILENTSKELAEMHNLAKTLDDTQQTLIAYCKALLGTTLE